MDSKPYLENELIKKNNGELDISSELNRYNDSGTAATGYATLGTLALWYRAMRLLVHRCFVFPD